jgi:FxsC-like protein
MGYEFFLSYTRANNDAYLKQFFADVCDVVRDRRGLPKTAEVAFFDQSEIELGEDWDGAIVEALQTSNVVVPLFSPGYFKSEYCGKELALFRDRLAALPGAALPPLIKPIVWVPFGEVPPALQAGQYTFGDPGAIHNTKGFKYLLKQRQEYATEYNDLVEKLAVEILSAADTHPLPRLSSVPTLRSTVSLFKAAPGVAPVVGTVPPSGPKHVRFVYVAADPQRFGNARPQEPYLDCGGGDWKPFYPANTTRVHRFVQNVVSADDLDFTSEELEFTPNLVSEVAEAWERREIVVLIVDGWSVSWDADFRAILSQLDQRLDYHWCVLVPWNEQDGESMTLRARIADSLSQTFDRHANLARNPMFYRDGIKSSEELKTALREVLMRLKDEIRKRAPVHMPVPAGPDKSVLQGPTAAQG